jgi:hypothetical protein
VTFRITPTDGGDARTIEHLPCREGHTSPFGVELERWRREHTCPRPARLRPLPQIRISPERPPVAPLRFEEPT